jgi:hypothetical protein
MTRHPAVIHPATEPEGRSEPSFESSAAGRGIDYDLAPGLGAIPDEITIGIVPHPAMRRRGAVASDESPSDRADPAQGPARSDDVA